MGTFLLLLWMPLRSSLALSHSAWHWPVPNPYRQHPSFPARVTHAEHCLKLLAEGRDRRVENGEEYSIASDRKFDDCFEMHDGDAVVLGTHTRAKSDAVLMRRIEKSCGNATALQHWYKVTAYRGRQLTLSI